MGFYVCLVCVSILLSVDEDETLKTIQDVYSQHTYFLCPHSAVGWKSAALFHAEHRPTGTQL